MRYLLILHKGLRADVDALSAAREQDPQGDAAKEYVAVIKALIALQEGREAEYGGKRLTSGPSSYDLRDCAELKVPVFDEYKDDGWPLGPSHRLTYREFDPLPRVEDGRVVADPDAQPYRHVVAFVHRADDPAAVTGDRLGRTRGLLEPELHGLGGGERPSVGPQREGAPTTPHRIPVPGDLLKAAQILRDSPPAGTAPKPAAAPQANVSRPSAPGTSKSKDR
ncbi:hypothetical protein EV651_101715 [Kribbella sp. VKM Ac-2571]|uniref:hypothetical protein n=1 Tax=Kribbella sp. VKM Ac-2571 TaxID=2512222 RepID=UPI001061B126|nr:hypothetical protein [Kribbella sp. VKM Ac-2571]TDO69670.1 hypothetical protein EV651_101715 [Kribbella sp. VKM Ac-2571]